MVLDIGLLWFIQKQSQEPWVSWACKFSVQVVARSSKHLSILFFICSVIICLVHVLFYMIRIHQYLSLVLRSQMKFNAHTKIYSVSMSLQNCMTSEIYLVISNDSSVILTDCLHSIINITWHTMHDNLNSRYLWWQRTKYFTLLGFCFCSVIHYHYS